MARKQKKPNTDATQEKTEFVPEVVVPDIVLPEVVPEVVLEVLLPEVEVPEVEVPEVEVPEVVVPEVVVPEVVVPEVVVQEVEVQEVVVPDIKSTLNILFTEVKTGSDLEKWVDHHIKIGFSHIYMVDYGFCAGKLDHIPRDKLTVIPSKKHIPDILQQAYKFSLKYGFDWMLYLNTNEYLNIDNISTFLHQHKETEVDLTFLVNSTTTPITRHIFFLKLN